MHKLLPFFLIFLSIQCIAQTEATVFRITSSFTSFPDTGRVNGHSGAFRVMAHIVQQGGVEVKQVILFDGLYSQVDKYTNWIEADTTHRFLNLYTNKGGGTDEVSADMMKLLREKNIPFLNPEEKAVDAAMLKNNPVIFIHSLKEHNDVINRPDHNFRLFLENIPPLKTLQ